MAERGGLLAEIRVFFLDVARRRSALIELARRDFEEQYLGSSLGMVWVLLQPLCFMLVLYLVFTFGLRPGAAGLEVPFGLYLFTGMIAWLYFSQNLGACAAVIRRHAYLLRKVNVRLGILPAVPLLGSLAAHLCFIALAVGLAALNGYGPGLVTLQVFYYLGAMVVLLLGLGLLTSATNVFLRDVAKVVAVLLQFGFWLTPIFWNPELAPERFQWLVRLNPVAYVVTGYRDSIILGLPFWRHPLETAWFWLLTLTLLAVGVAVFRRLRPHFAEVI